MNTVYTISSESHPDDGIVMKVFGEASKILMDRDGEYRILKHLTQHTDMVHLYCK